MLKTKNKIKYIALTLVIICLGLISYHNKRLESCAEILKDERNLKQYFVQKDSCNSFKNFKSVKYSDNSGLVMSGYNDRLYKQGPWTYYNDSSILAEGKFENGEPIGEWKFLNFPKTYWKKHEDSILGYTIKVPYSWSIKESKNYAILASFDDKTIEKANINLVVSDYDANLFEILKNDNNELNDNDTISEFEFMQNIITGFDEVYERKYKIKYDSQNYIIYQHFYANKISGKVYIFTINSDYSNYNQMIPFFEPIHSSLKFYEN